MRVSDRLSNNKYLSRDFRKWLGVSQERIAVLLIVLLFSFICLFRFLCALHFPELGDDLTPVQGTIVQSLASVFAIVFSVSLVAIQLCSEELSHRLIRLYVRDLSFSVPFILNLGALLFNWFLLVNRDFRTLIDYGIFWSFAAILSLVPFVIYTIRFLTPDHVVDRLLIRVTTRQLLANNFAEDKLYQNSLQPIEDIISNRIRHGDNTTAINLIKKVQEKMNDALFEVNKRIEAETEDSILSRIMIYTNLPFARLHLGIATSSNKSDAMEITVYIINSIATFVQKFWQSGFVPAFKIYDNAIDQILSQARYRYSSDEYKIDRAKLEFAVARARAKFAGFVG